MDYGIISVIPVVVMVVGSLITKRMIEMSIISSVLAGILLFKKDFFVGYLGTQFYETLGGDTYSAIFFILLGFGAIIEIASKSGALNGFAKVLGKYANSRKKSLLITYLLQWILFADDYLMTLGSCYSMRTITDENKVPERASVAYGNDRSKQRYIICTDVQFLLFLPLQPWQHTSILWSITFVRCRT